MSSFVIVGSFIWLVRSGWLSVVDSVVVSLVRFGFFVSLLMSGCVFVSCVVVLVMFCGDRNSSLLCLKNGLLFGLVMGLMWLVVVFFCSVLVSVCVVVVVNLGVGVLMIVRIVLLCCGNVLLMVCLSVVYCGFVLMSLLMLVLILKCCVM